MAKQKFIEREMELNKPCSICGRTHNTHLSFCELCLRQMDEKTREEKRKMEEILTPTSRYAIDALLSTIKCWNKKENEYFFQKLGAQADEDSCLVFVQEMANRGCLKNTTKQGCFGPLTHHDV